MKIKHTIAGIVAALVGFHANVQAVPTLTLTDNLGNTTSVTSAAGFANYIGALGGWNINVSTGLGYPQPGFGTITNPQLDLNSVNVFGGGLGNVLTITWTIDNVGPLAGTIYNQVGGTQNGITSQFFSAVNGVNLTSLSFNTTPFSGSADALAVGGAGSTVSLIAVLTANQVGANASFDSHASVPDGGMTVMLLGGALSGLALLRKKLA